MVPSISADDVPARSINILTTSKTKLEPANNMMGRETSNSDDGSALSEEGEAKNSEVSESTTQSFEDASKPPLSLRSGISNGTGLSSLSTLTSIKAVVGGDAVSDISTSASDRKKKGDSSSDTSSGDDKDANKLNLKHKLSSGDSDAVSDVSASGDSDNDPKKRKRDANGNGNDMEETDKGAGGIPSAAKKARSVDSRSSGGGSKTRFARSGSDSGELSSESSWGSSEEGAITDAEGGRSSRMYTSEMSSVSASGSYNASSHGGSDDGKDDDDRDNKPLGK